MDDNDWKNEVDIRKPLKYTGQWDLENKWVITTKEQYLINPRKQEGDWFFFNFPWL